MKNQAIEATLAAVANKAVYAGGGTAFIGGITANVVAAFGGLLVAVVGLAVQWYYKRKDDRRKEEVHRLRITGALRSDDE